MHESQAQPPSRPGNGLAQIRGSFDRLAALWSTPQVGRVAICSPVVGVIAGEGIRSAGVKTTFSICPLPAPSIAPLAVW